MGSVFSIMREQLLIADGAYGRTEDEVLLSALYPRAWRSEARDAFLPGSQ